MTDTTTTPANGQAPTEPLDALTRQEAREARVAAARAAEKKRRDDRRAEKRAARQASRDRTRMLLATPPRVDWRWGAWIGSGVLLTTVAAFGWRISERADRPVIVQNVVPGAATATPTSGLPARPNPLAGVGRPLGSSAALMIGSADERGETITVKLTSGDVDLGAARVEDVAGQLWALGPTDPCKLSVVAPDARRVIVVPPVDGKAPVGATPLFDCTPPSTTPTSAAGTS